MILFLEITKVIVQLFQTSLNQVNFKMENFSKTMNK